MYIGIEVKESSHNYLFNNFCFDNDYYGIKLGFNTNFTIVSYNIISKNWIIGIGVYSAFNAEIYKNNISLNKDYGLGIWYSENITVSHNNFLSNNIGNNLSQAFDDNSTMNFWYDMQLYQGNFWSDLIWNEGVVYEINGANNTDPYPLEFLVDISSE
jgi:parallel beta-helix repeat protein